jgi:tetratricopeptide (TPR) repeat protein
MWNRWTGAFLSAALASGVAGSAQAAITVLGGGFAQACSEAAVTGELDRKFEELCTLALDTEALNARDRAGTLVNRGVFKLRRQEYNSALRDFEAALKRDPTMGEALVNRGAARLGLKSPEAALADINRALELGVSEPAKAYYNRAIAHERLGDIRSAWLDYTKAAELDPEWDAPRKELARFTVSRK